MLLVGPGDIAAAAVPLPLDSPPLAATIAPLAATYYVVSSDAGGKLLVTLEAPGFEARLSLVDSSGQPLIQSDSSASSAGLIDENVPAGDDFLEVQSLSGAGAYQITAGLTPTVPPFQTIPTSYAGHAPIGTGYFFGDAAAGRPGGAGWNPRGEWRRHLPEHAARWTAG